MNSRSNLRLEDNAEVKRIHFETKGVAKSVVLTNGREFFLNAFGKLVLTAGTFQTTRLLQFSGILKDFLLSEKAVVQPCSIKPTSQSLV